MKAITLAAALALTGCATSKYDPYYAAGADTATTAYAISQGLTETNPLGPLGATLLKLPVLWYINSLDNEQDRKLAGKISTSMWGGAAVNNLAAIAGAGLGLSLPIGILAGILLYNRDDGQAKHGSFSYKRATNEAECLNWNIAYIDYLDAKGVKDFSYPSDACYK